MRQSNLFRAVLGLLVMTGLLAGAGALYARTAVDEMAMVRVAHLAPFATDAAVTITLNGDEFLTEFGYGDSTTYVEVPPGSYDVEIFFGGVASPFLSETIMVEGGKSYSVVATGDTSNQPLHLLVLEDDNTAPAAGQFHLRLVHAAPFNSGGATADIRLQDDTIVADDVDFAGATGYIPLPAGTYDLKITTPDGATTLIDPLPVTFNEGDIVTAFATGDGSNQLLGAFAWPVDVEGFFLPIATGKTFLRVAHLAPFAMDPDTSVTVSLDGAPALTDFQYGDSTAYIELDPGDYLVEVLPGGAPPAAISATVTLAAETYYTAVAYGDGVNQPLGLLALEDDNAAPAAGQFHLRLGHLAPFASGNATADVRLQDGTVVLDDVNFGDVTGYIPLAAGEYDLKITTPDGMTTLIDPLPATFNEGDLVTAFATGEGANQPLGVFAWPVDVEGFFLPLDVDEAYLRVAHLAPFAMDPDTSVTVSLNGTPTLTEVEYGDSTPYLTLEPGDYLVEIFPGGGTTAAISATVTLEDDMYYSAVAVGDGVNQNLDLLALVDDNTTPAAGQFHLRLGHLAPFASGDATADVRLQDGTVVADDVNFGDVTGYIPLPAGTYDLKITTPDGMTTLIDPRPATFAEGDIVTAFASGDGVNQPLGVFAWPVDVAGFFLPLTTDEYVIYLPVIQP